MFSWTGLRFHELTQVPRPPRPKQQDGEEDGRRLPPSLSAALTASLAGSHAELLATGHPAPALVSAWIRAPRESNIHFLLAGRPGFPPAVGELSEPVPGAPHGVRQVLFPPGAAAADVSAPDALALLERFPLWMPCAGRPDALAPSEPKAGDLKAIKRGSFDRQAAHLSGAFAWLVIAEPLGPHEIQPELDLLVNEILPLSRTEVGEGKRLVLERKRARHRELSRAQVGGAWRVRVLAAGIGAPAADTRGDAQRSAAAATATVAAMLCASAELDSLPYTLAPAGYPMPLAQAIADKTDDAYGSRSSFTAGTDLLVALTRPPMHELPGVRLVEPHTFDVTAEDPSADGLRLGTILNEAMAPVGTVILESGSLNRHTFVCGATGSGKSETVRHLLTEATKAGLPWLAIEPAKAEYSRMADRVAPFGGEVVVLCPSDQDQPSAGLNPLEPAKGFSLQTHADLLRALFLASFESQEPFPQILAAAITRCYEEAGWDLTLGTSNYPDREPRYPTLGDLQRAADAVVTDIGYSQEITDNVRGFIKVRMGSLRTGTTGRFFEGGHPIDFAKLLAGNVVLEIENVGDDADKAFFMGIVLMRLTEYLRTNAERGPVRLKHLTVVEEAHRLLRKPPQGAAGPAAHAVELFAAMLAEVRAYGEGLIIAEQIPDKLIPDVIKNTAVKIVHRLPAEDDREAVGATMNLDEKQSAYLVTLRPGTGAVFTDGMDRPLLVRVPEPPKPPDPALPSTAFANPVLVNPLLANPVPTKPVLPVSPTRIIKRRSSTCGRECSAEPCTLLQMRTAENLPASEPWFSLWAELAVLAHIAGHAMPVPRIALIQALADRKLTWRLVDCAISHAVDDAVAVRSTALQPQTDPVVLAGHVCTAMRRVLTGKEAGCGADAFQYLAKPFRWRLVLEALVRDGAAPDDGPHPSTAEWEARFRRRIPGATRAAQQEAVKAFLVAEYADVRRRTAAVHGIRRPSTLDALIATASGGLEQQVRQLLDDFPECGWALVHLVPDDEGTGTGGQR